MPYRSRPAGSSFPPLDLAEQVKARFRRALCYEKLGELSKAGADITAGLAADAENADLLKAKARYARGRGCAQSCATLCTVVMLPLRSLSWESPSPTAAPYNVGSPSWPRGSAFAMARSVRRRIEKLKEAEKKKASKMYGKMFG